MPRGTAWLLERLVEVNENPDGTVTVTLLRCDGSYKRVKLEDLFFDKDVYTDMPPADGRRAFADASICRILKYLLPLLNIAYSRNASHTSSADLGAKDAGGKRYMWAFRKVLWQSDVQLVAAEEGVDMRAALKKARRAYRDQLEADKDDPWHAWLAWTRTLFERIPFGGRGGECWFRVSNCDAMKRAGFLGAVLGLFAIYMPSLPKAVARVRAARASNYTCREERLAALASLCEAMRELASGEDDPASPIQVMLRQFSRRHGHLSRAPCLGDRILRANFLHRDQQKRLNKKHWCLWRVSISGGKRCLELLLVLPSEEGGRVRRCWQVLIPLERGEAVWTSFRFNTGQPVRVRIDGEVYTVRGCHCNLGIELPEIGPEATYSASGDVAGAQYTAFLLDGRGADRLAGVHISGFFNFPEGAQQVRNIVNLLADMELVGADEEGEGEEEGEEEFDEEAEADAGPGEVTDESEYDSGLYEETGEDTGDEDDSDEADAEMD